MRIFQIIKLKTKLWPCLWTFLLQIRTSVTTLLFPRRPFSWIRHFLIAVMLLALNNVLVILVPTIKYIFGFIGKSERLCFSIYFFKFYFSITVHIRYYFVLVSGGQHSGWTIIHFTKWFPSISSPHLAPHTVITILLTVFPMLYFTTLWLFCNYQFVLLNPFTFLFSWLKLLKWHTGSLCWEVKDPRWSQAHRIPSSPVGLQVSPSLPPRWHWKLFTGSENMSKATL